MSTKFVVVFFTVILLAACGGSPAVDVEATVAAAVEATQAANPTDTPVPPTATPEPPTATPEPPTATPEPTETSTPEATPTPTGPKLEFKSASDFVDGIDYWHIVGEIENISQDTLGFVKIVATAYDESGGIVDTGFTYIELDVLNPGELSPFEITIENNDAIYRYDLQADAQPATSLPYRDLTILSSTDRVDDIGYWHIVGEVENTGDRPSEFVKIVATIYDESSQVVEVAFTYSELDTISPGSKSPFEVTLESSDRFHSYVLQVEGQ